MPTTNKQLREWLAQFPDDALIEVITTEETRGHYESYTMVSEVDFECEPVKGLKSYADGKTFEVEAKYDFKTDTSTIKTIRLGRKLA